ncbi:MAG TPA: YoaK family protein [Ensifer sp.]|nr:YoaK family protein [Ensifer sp.]
MTRIGGTAMEARHWPVVRILLSIKFVLLVAACVFAFWHGPFRDADALATVAIGMVLVSAMAVQNTVHRAHMSKTPPSTLMTGTTTQIMVDIADLISGNVSQGRHVIKARLSRMALSLASFAVGCVSAAGAFLASNTWCFIVPPILVGLALMTALETEDSH